MATSPTSPDALARQFLEVMPPLMHNLGNSMRRADESDISTMTQLTTLRALALCKGALTFKELVKQRRVSAPTLSRSLEAMVKRGWVARVPHPNDKRQVLLALTPAGEEEFAAIRKRTRAHVAKWMRALTDEQRQSFAAILESLHALHHKHE